MECIIHEEKPVGSLMIFCGYLLSLLGGMVGLLIGSRLLRYDVDVRGQRVYMFDQQTRKHGKIMVGLAGGVIFCGLILNISLKV